MLTAEQRADLEEMGAANVRMHLVGLGAPGLGATIPGFKSGNITRGAIYDWLAEQDLKETRRQSSILLWARIAGWAAIAGVALMVAQIWLKK